MIETEKRPVVLKYALDLKRVTAEMAAYLLDL